MHKKHRLNASRASKQPIQALMPNSVPDVLWLQSGRTNSQGGRQLDVTSIANHHVGIGLSRQSVQFEASHPSDKSQCVRAILRCRYVRLCIVGCRECRPAQTKQKGESLSNGLHSGFSYVKDAGHRMCKLCALNLHLNIQLTRAFRLK